MDLCGDLLDDTDAALLRALRARPRTSWTLLGRALRIHPATAARRWKRFRESGWAWITASPDLCSGAVAGAFLELDCDSGSSDRIAEVAVLDPRVASVERTGGGELLLTLVAADVPALSALVLDGVDDLGGVRSSRLHVVSGAENGCQAAETAVAGGFSDDTRALLLALAPDARRPAAELAERVGTSASAVRRRIRTTVESGLIALHCEVAQPLRTAPVVAHYWACAPVRALERCVRTVRAVPPVRRCAVLTGASNLLITARLDAESGLAKLERALVRGCPDVQLTGRAVVHRTWKRRGWLLDERGLPTGCQPVDPWSSSPALSGEPL